MKLSSKYRAALVTIMIILMMTGITQTQAIIVLCLVMCMALGVISMKIEEDNGEQKK